MALCLKTFLRKNNSSFRDSKNYFSCKHLAIFWLIFFCPSFTSVVFFLQVKNFFPCRILSCWRGSSRYPAKFQNLGYHLVPVGSNLGTWVPLGTAYRGNFRTWVLDTRKRLDTYEKISNNYQSSKSDVYWIPRVSRPMYRQRGILCVISSIRLKVFNLVLLIFMFEQVAKKSC